MARSNVLPVRLDDEQYEQFERAAKAVGKKVSEWLRDLGAREVSPPVERVPQYQKVGGGHAIDDRNPPGVTYGLPRKRTAAELAASIPGVRVGMGENFFDAGDAPVEDVVLFDWDKQFAKWASHGEEGDREMTEYFQEHRVDGGFWKRKTKAGRLLWCKENVPEGLEPK